METNPKSYQFPFEKLKVWQQAKQFSLQIYEATKAFPPEEKFGLVSQLRRSAISIASNIAEGSARHSRKDQAHFSQIAYSSLMETVCQLDIATELEFIVESRFEELRNSACELAYMINALHKSQKSN